jgi:flagellar capping protein FliD
MERLMAISKEIQSQMANLPERVGIVETKVESIREQITDLKGDVKDMHDCLDQTRDSVLAQLDKMTGEYRANAEKYYVHAEKLNEQQSAQHTELAGKLETATTNLDNKIKDLQSVKDKWVKYGMIALAFMAGAGWIHAANIKDLIKLIGL